MNSLKKLLIVSLFVLGLMIVYPISGFSQLPPGGCDPLDPACPIDGGLSVLIAAGIGLGARKIYKERKKGSEIS